MQKTVYPMMNAPSSTRSNKDKFKAALNRSLNERSKAMAASVQPTQRNISQTQDSQPPPPPQATPHHRDRLLERLALYAAQVVIERATEVDESVAANQQIFNETHHPTEEKKLTRSSYPE